MIGGDDDEVGDGDGEDSHTGVRNAGSAGGGSTGTTHEVGRKDQTNEQ